MIAVPNQPPITPKSKPPKSCVGWWDSVIALGTTFIVFFALRMNETLTDAELSCAMMAANALTVGTLEILRAPWRESKASDEKFGAIAKRAGVKFLGIAFTIAVIGFFYWLFPEYRRSYYEPYFEALRLLLPYATPVIAAYLLWAEWRIPVTNDGSWQAGLLVLGRWREIDFNKLKQHALGWLVKGYFLAIMFGDLAAGLPDFRFGSWDLLSMPFPEFYSLIFNSSITFELVFVAAGYLFTCRLFNAQIRSVENTLYGWTIAVISYGPFLAITYSRYFGYRSDINWQEWLAGHETLALIWGSVILVFMIIHLWSDACFGVRFSNLTNRGIITNGAYRYCKHPAYLIKNIRWWMVSVPFAAAGGWEEALRLSLLLVCVNVVYTLRAATEEKLLSQDPTYVEYGLWMDRHSLMRWVGQVFPRFKYERRLKKWLERGELKILPAAYFQQTAR